MRFEVWTFVAQKQARLTMEERETRHDIGDVYLWTAVGNLSRPAAMMAGITDRLWNFQDLFDELMVRA